MLNLEAEKVLFMIGTQALKKEIREQID